MADDNEITGLNVEMLQERELLAKLPMKSREVLSAIIVCYLDKLDVEFDEKMFIDGTAELAMVPREVVKRQWLNVKNKKKEELQ